jgi:pimeloyl-ACP methyl ester carboxylesterase
VADGSVRYAHGAVAYRDFGGSGPAVMLAHGLGGNLAHWGRVTPLLRERYRLIAIDLPSHGASTAPAVYSYDHDLGAVDEVRQTLGLDRPALIGHSYGGMLAVALGAGRPGDYRVVVNVDGLGFALDTEEARPSGTDALPAEPSVNEGDAEWLEAEISREVEEAAAIGLHLDRDGEMVRRAFQLGDDGRWHSSPTIDRFLEIGHFVETLRLVPAYAASSCRTVTVIADHRYGPDEEAVAGAQRRTDEVRVALAAAGSELDSVPSGHYPHVEAPEVTAERFGRWVGG